MLVCFALSEDIVCALPTAAVREILPVPRLWSPPGLPGGHAGFLNLRGRAVSIVDLGPFLEGAPRAGPPPLYGHLIGLHAAPGLLLMVECVTDVAEPAAVLPVDDPERLRGCVEAEAEIGGRLVHLLSPERLIGARERAMLDGLNAQAERRLAEWSAASL